MRRGRSVSLLKHEAGNHQSSVSPVPWEGILGNENDESACDGSVMYCSGSISFCIYRSCVRGHAFVNSLTQE